MTLQRRSVVAGEDVGTDVDDPLQHRRNDDEHVGAVLGDIAQGRLRVEATLLEDDLALERERNRELGQSGAVKDRCRHDHRGAVRDRHPVHELCGRKHRNLVAGSPLRCPGGARGEDYHAARPLRCIDLVAALACHEIVEGQRRRVHLVALVYPGEDARDLVRDRVEQADELAVVQDRADLLALGDVCELRLREAGVHQHDPHAQFSAGEQRQNEAAVVAGEQGDDAARADTAGGEAADQRVRLPVDLPVGQRPAFVLDGGRVGVAVRHTGDHTSERAKSGHIRDGEQGVVGAPQVEELAPAHHVDAPGQIGGFAQHGSRVRQGWTHLRQPNAPFSSALLRLSNRRAMISCWICWVPSKMSRIFESRPHFSSRVRSE